MERHWTINEGLSSLVDLYDAFVLDQFGVLHDGVSPTPGAVDCCRRLAEAGKRLLILSNSSALEAPTLARLDRMGFEARWFAGATTSGGVALPRLAAGEWGRRCVLFSWADPRNREVLREANLEASDVEHAEFVLAQGTQVMQTASGDDVVSIMALHDHNDAACVLPTLQRAAARGLTLVCVNADRVVVLPGGGIARMPGTLAQLYETLGGRVVYFGKPHREHFLACLERAGTTAERTVHVGDSLEHDVAGACGAGLRSLFVASGIHKDELHCDVQTLAAALDVERLTALFEAEHIAPTHVVPAFRW